MKFLMMVCIDTEPVPTPDSVPDVDEWVETMDGRGVRLLGEPLRPESEARTVRVRDGETMVTDGPFVETKEVLAGFDVLECADIAEAIQVAAGHPMAYTGVIDIRPMYG